MLINIILPIKFHPLAQVLTGINDRCARNGGTSFILWWTQVHNPRLLHTFSVFFTTLVLKTMMITSISSKANHGRKYGQIDLKSADVPIVNQIKKRFKYVFLYHD